MRNLHCPVSPLPFLDILYSLGCLHVYFTETLCLPLEGQSLFYHHLEVFADHGLGCYLVSTMYTMESSHL